MATETPNRCLICGTAEDESLTTYHYEPVTIRKRQIVKFFCSAECQPVTCHYCPEALTGHNLASGLCTPCAANEYD